MKKYIVCILIVLVFGVVYVFRKDLYRIYLEQIVFKQEEIVLGTKNAYYRDQDFAYVQQTNSFLPATKEDLISIYYTIINAGKKKFTFYCPKSYKSCISDVKEIANNQVLLSHINNFVHPFNGFKHIETEYDSYGAVTLRIEPTYTQEKIQAIVAKKNEIEKEIWTSNMSIQEKIEAAHDYIINHTRYDKDRSDSNIVRYQSDTAYGSLIDGIALCGGYTDAMALFLEDLNVKNFKISSENHVWNAVELNHVWYHLDLTWDDPVMSDNSDQLEHNFFLITSEELKELEDLEHRYPENIYKEVS